MQFKVFQQRRPIHIPGTEEDHEANLHLVGTFEFTDEEEAKKVMRTRFPFRNGVGLGQHPILEKVDA